MTITIISSPICKLIRKKLFIILTAVLLGTGLILQFSGCALYGLIAFRHELLGVIDSASDQNMGSDPTEIASSSDQVTIAWDAPPSAVDSYKVLFRIHDTQDWYLLNQIPAVADPDYTVLHADLGNGIYDFGIIAVDTEGQESLVHFSLEETADPSAGWYLAWQL
jgi:hypothetical protein